MLRRRVVISGRVQGVSFRRSTQLEAAKFSKISGYVKNLPNGAVEAVFQGEDAQVLALMAWCRKGPPLAMIARMEVIEEQVEGDSDLKPGEFKIL
jgi:acylphosphatase